MRVHGTLNRVLQHLLRVDVTAVALIHGWGGSFSATWQRNGFTALLEDSGASVIGIDLLGHGDAPKPHDPDAYGDLTTRIVEALPDEPVDAVGFSLGAMTLLRAAIDDPTRFNRLILAGVGSNIFKRDDATTRQIIEGLDLVASGGDGTFGDGNEVAIVPVTAIVPSSSGSASQPDRTRSAPNSSAPITKK